MGTSASSSGPGPGVPFVPPWVPPANPPFPQPFPQPDPPENLDEDGDVAEQPPENEVRPVSPIAPPRRFAAARRRLGEFGAHGERRNLEAGLGHYVRGGMGGAARGAARMAGTARTAGALREVLEALGAGRQPAVDLGFDSRELTGRAARDVIDIIANAIRPVDGTQDAEASRDALVAATVDLLSQFQDADLASLEPEQVDVIVESYVGHDLCRRVELDVGKAILAKAPDPATGVRRFNEIRQYIIEKVAACFRKRRENGDRLNRGGFTALTSAVIRDTLGVFEEYL